MGSGPMGLRPAKSHEKQSRVAQTCRTLACLRPSPEGAYIPPNYGGTYAPPWFFDSATCGMLHDNPPPKAYIADMRIRLVVFLLLGLLVFAARPCGASDLALVGAKIYPSPTEPPIENGSISFPLTLVIQHELV